ncbi:MAG: hypothetical protein JXA43_00810 [Candidatus Diapherotrites archaeon]|nr:hypothetical protein [Candidatus Diapherotrites archaeon]
MAVPRGIPAKFAKQRAAEREKEFMVQALVPILLVIGIIVVTGAIVVFWDIIGTNIFNYSWLIAIAIFGLYLFAKSDFLLKLNEYERAVVFRMGKFSRVAGPGWVLLVPGVETYIKVVVRTQMIDIPKQDVITRDKVELKADTVIYLRVKDPKKAILEIEDYKQSAQMFVLSALRDVVGDLTVTEVLQNIEKINQRLSVALARLTVKWGIDAQVELKDVDIPDEVLKSMHAAKAAEKDAEAMITRAKGKHAEIMAIRKATEGLTDENIVYYYLDTLKSLAEGRASKIIVPMELTKLADVFAGRVKPRGREAEKVDDLIEKYAGLVKDLELPEKIPIEKLKKVKKKIVKKKEENADELFE